MEWIYLVCNGRASDKQGDLVEGIPTDVADSVRETAQTHLGALCACAHARSLGKKLHDPLIQGVQYRGVPTSLYRIWCPEELRARRAELSENDAVKLDALLEAQGALEPLTRIVNLPSGYNANGEAPFGKSAPVYETIA